MHAKKTIVHVTRDKELHDLVYDCLSDFPYPVELWVDSSMEWYLIYYDGTEEDRDELYHIAKGIDIGFSVGKLRYCNA